MSGTSGSKKTQATFPERKTLEITRAPSRGKTRAAKSNSSKATSQTNPTQLEAINVALASQPGFTLLPPPQDYHWGNVSLPNDDSTNPKQLFMGEDGRQLAWAQLNTFNFRESKVKLFSEDKESNTITEIKLLCDFVQMPLCYPFKVFQVRKNVRKLSDVKIFVQYVYLEANITPTVFQEGQYEGAIDRLKAGLSAIRQEYNARGGVDQIPQMPKPGDWRESTPSSQASIRAVSEEECKSFKAKPEVRRDRTSREASEAVRQARDVIRTTNSLARLSVEPNNAAPIHKGKGKRAATDEDDFGDLQAARRLRRKQNEEDELMMELQERMEMMQDRKRARESKIEQCTKGKTPQDYQAYFLKSMRPKVILEEDEEEGPTNSQSTGVW